MESEIKTFIGRDRIGIDPGQYYHDDAGMHYNYQRYYDPGSGRYTTTDPIGIDGGDNLFAYVGGNPLNYIDQLGLYESDVHYGLNNKWAIEAGFLLVLPEMLPGLIMMLMFYMT